MTLTRLAWANLRAAPITSALNLGLLALGTATIVVLLLLSHQLSETLTRDSEGIDLGLGAKGSAVQLILASVYHADFPTGNISYKEAQRWTEDRRVDRAIPLSLGDSARGFRIVGTTHDYPALYGAGLAEGRLWEQKLEAVIGARVALATGLRPGDLVTGSHGLFELDDRHADSPYRVVGILASTGNVVDRLILTGLDSVWAVHGDGHDHEHGDDPDEEDDREITAMLMSYASPIAAVSLPNQINAESNLQAAAPAMELARLLQIVGLGLDGLRTFALILIVSAAFSVFGAMYGALQARRGELAMMRCLGGTRGELMASLLIEGLLLGLAGTALGLLIGHATVELVGSAFAASRGVTLTGAILLREELWLAGAMVLVALAAAAVPAWQAYRTDVSRTLASHG
jgi:putative ABC transport system permease protein